MHCEHAATDLRKGTSRMTAASAATFPEAPVVHTTPPLRIPGEHFDPASTTSIPSIFKGFAPTPKSSARGKLKHFCCATSKRKVMVRHDFKDGRHPKAGCDILRTGRAVHIQLHQSRPWRIFFLERSELVRLPSATRSKPVDKHVDACQFLALSSYILTQAKTSRKNAFVDDWNS